MRIWRMVMVVALLVASGGATSTAEIRGAAPASSPAFRLIVSAQNPRTSLDRKFVGDAFLKKVTRWDDLEVIRPVDQSANAAVRRAFTDQVVRRSVAAVKNYWQQLVFSGRDVPPPELDSDEAVVAYVARVPGAIGYVSSAANLQGVKAVELR